MRPEAIREYLHREPFKPFRLHLGDGREFEIRHPEFVLVFRNAVEIGVTEDASSPFPERGERVSLLHIASLEDLQAA
jgi:hypothetical protein